MGLQYIVLHFLVGSISFIFVIISCSVIFHFLDIKEERSVKNIMQNWIVLGVFAYARNYTGIKIELGEFERYDVLEFISFFIVFIMVINILKLVLVPPMAKVYFHFWLKKMANKYPENLILMTNNNHSSDE
jgi:hypothetical protein